MRSRNDRALLAGKNSSRQRARTLETIVVHIYIYTSGSVKNIGRPPRKTSPDPRRRVSGERFPRFLYCIIIIIIIISSRRPTRYRLLLLLLMTMRWGIVVERTARDVRKPSGFQTKQKSSGKKQTAARHKGRRNWWLNATRRLNERKFRTRIVYTAVMSFRRENENSNRISTVVYKKKNTLHFSNI